MVGPSRAHPGAAAGASAAASRDPPSSSREPAALPPAGQVGAGEPRCALRGSLRTGRRGRVAVSCVATGLVAGVKDGAAAAEKPGLISGASGGAGGKAWEWLWPEVAERPCRCAGPSAGNGRRPHAGEEKAMRPCEPGVRCLRSGHSRGTRRGRPCARGRAQAPGSRAHRPRRRGGLCPPSWSLREEDALPREQGVRQGEAREQQAGSLCRCPFRRAPGGRRGSRCPSHSTAARGPRSGGGAGARGTPPALRGLHLGRVGPRLPPLAS